MERSAPRAGPGEVKHVTALVVQVIVEAHALERLPADHPERAMVVRQQATQLLQTTLAGHHAPVPPPLSPRGISVGRCRTKGVSGTRRRTCRGRRRQAHGDAAQPVSDSASRFLAGAAGCETRRPLPISKPAVGPVSRHGAAATAG